jgi:Ser/Thr protein kinase RdoA (MazF antagonist)
LIFLEKKKFEYQLPIPLKSNNGERIIETGKGYGILYKRIEGKMIKKFSPENIGEIARLQAKFHKITEDFKFNKKIIRFHKFVTLSELKDYYDISKLNNKNDKYLLSNIDFIKKASNFVIDKISKADKGIIHSDINGFNTLFNKEKITGIIDFENFNFAPRLFDIAYTIKMICFRNNILDVKLVKIFFEEYSKIYPLPKDYEKDLLPTILFDNCIYFIRAHKNKRTKELHETVETSKYLYEMLSSKDKLNRFVTLIRLQL